jgi:hypothetical protein
MGKPNGGRTLNNSIHLKAIEQLLEIKDNDESKMSYGDIVKIVKKQFHEKYSVQQLKRWKLDTMNGIERKMKARETVLERMSDPDKIINILEQRKELLIAQRKRLENILLWEEKFYFKKGELKRKAGAEINRYNVLLNSYREDLQAIGLLEMQSQTYIGTQTNVIQQNQAIFDIGSLPMDAQKQIADIVMIAKQEAEHDPELEEVI